MYSIPAPPAVNTHASTHLHPSSMTTFRSPSICNSLRSYEMNIDKNPQDEVQHRDPTKCSLPFVLKHHSQLQPNDTQVESSHRSLLSPTSLPRSPPISPPVHEYQSHDHENEYLPPNTSFKSDKRPRPASLREGRYRPAREQTGN